MKVDSPDSHTHQLVGDTPVTAGGQCTIQHVSPLFRWEARILYNSSLWLLSLSAPDWGWGQGFHDRNFWKLKVQSQMSASLVSCLSPWLAGEPLPCPNLFLEDTTSIRVGPTLMTSLYLNELYKDPISTYSHDMRYWVRVFSPRWPVGRWRPGWILSFENLKGASTPSDSFHYLQKTPAAEKSINA